MAPQITIGIQARETSRYRILKFTPLIRQVIKFSLLLNLIGIILFAGTLTKWAFNKSSFSFYKRENTQLKKELDDKIDELQYVIGEIEHYQNIERNIKIRYGINDNSGELPLATGGRQSSEDIFIALTDPLENKFQDIHNLSSFINRNLLVSHKNLKLIENYMNYQKEVWLHTPYILPANGYISSQYGMRMHPLRNVIAKHLGVDIAGQKWTPVYASASGRVIKSYKSQSFGNLVVIEHGNGYTTKYAHLAQRLVKKGALVKRYEHLGYLGESGHTTGPHLHYEVHRDNTPHDPANYILPEGVLVD